MNNIEQDTDIYNSTQTIYSRLVENINSDINKLIELRLYPLIEKMQRNENNMKIIEHILYQLPEFQKIKKENEELKQMLSNKNELGEHTILQQNEIKLEIIEQHDNNKTKVTLNDIYNGSSYGNNDHCG